MVGGSYDDNGKFTPSDPMERDDSGYFRAQEEKRSRELEMMVRHSAGLQIASVQVAVSPYEEELFKDEPGFRDSMRSSACRQLAEMIAKDHSVFYRIEPPTPDRKYIDPVMYRWTVGFQSDTKVVEDFNTMQGQARRDGRLEAANMAIARAERLQRTGYGGCLHVICNELREFAEELRKHK